MNTTPLEIGPGSAAVAAGADPGATRADRAGRHAWYALVVLVIATVLAFIDRQILVLVAQALRDTLQLTDMKLGLLQGVAMALFAGVAALPLGWLADRMSRPLLLALCVLVWSAASVARGLSGNFEQLFAATALLGIAEAGLVPIVYGLIPDLFSGRARITANAVYALTVALGSAASLVFSGLVIQGIESARPVLMPALQAYDTWRLALFAVAVPGPVVALLVLTIRVARRAGHGAAAQTNAADHASFGGHLRTHWRALAGFFGGLGLLSLALTAVVAWSPIVLTREFGVTASEVGVRAGAVAIVAIALGFAVAHRVVGRHAGRLGAILPLRVCVVGGIVAGAAAGAMLFAASPAMVYLLLGVQLAALTAGTVLAPTAIQDLGPPQLRSRVAGVGVVTGVLFQAASPLLVGALSDGLGSAAHSLRVAVAIVAVLAFGMGAFVMKVAEAPVRKTMEESV